MLPNDDLLASLLRDLLDAGSGVLLLGFCCYRGTVEV